MNIESLRRQLIRHEGYRTDVYLDSLGYKTAGIGHLLTGPSKDLPVGHIVSKGQIDTWFEDDIKVATAKARRIVGESFDQMDDVRQRCMIDLAFNLGDKLSQFHNTLRFLRQAQWKQASENLKQSLWYSQVKSRGVTICDAIASGRFKFESTK